MRRTILARQMVRHAAALREATEEYSILLELARKLRKRPVLVTFNGKSFDWPLLVSRCASACTCSVS